MKYLLLTALVYMGSVENTLAQANWKGFNIGLDVNYHYLFGGAQVDGVETIGDGNRFALGGLLGYTWHFKRDIVFGTEFQINQPLGAFENNEHPDGTVVSYTIKPQTALQFNLGKALGEKKTHFIQGYFAINQTRFDIDIARPTGNWKQTDFENFGRIGLGYEYSLSNQWSVRVQAGTSMDALPDTDNGLDSKLNVKYHF